MVITTCRGVDLECGSLHFCNSFYAEVKFLLESGFYEVESPSKILKTDMLFVAVLLYGCFD